MLSRNASSYSIYLVFSAVFLCTSNNLLTFEIIIYSGLNNPSSKEYFEEANEKCEHISKIIYRISVVSIYIIYIPSIIVNLYKLFITGIEIDDYKFPFDAW